MVYERRKIITQPHHFSFIHALFKMMSNENKRTTLFMNTAEYRRKCLYVESNVCVLLAYENLLREPEADMISITS